VKRVSTEPNLSTTRYISWLSTLLLSGHLRHTSGHPRTLAWACLIYCGLDKPPSRDTTDRFSTDLKHVIDDIFDRLVEQAAVGGLLNSTYTIDSTHVEAIQYNDAASWDQDPTTYE
jgi:hypothetical protein